MKAPKLLPIAVGLLVLCLMAANAQQYKPCDYMKMMLSADKATAKRGMDAFLKMGARGATPLVCFIAGTAPGCPDATEVGRQRGERVLVEIGSDAVPSILQRLNDPDDGLRTRLVRVLGRIQDSRGREAMRKLWDTEKVDRVRAALVTALTAGPGWDAAALLPPRYAPAGPKERAAIVAYWALKDKGEQVSAALQPLGKDDRGKVIDGAIQVLKDRGGKAARAAIARLKALK